MTNVVQLPKLYRTSIKHDFFTWDKATKSFVTKVSQFRHLTRLPTYFQICGKVEIAEYQYSHEEYSEEGEVLSWVYLPTEESLNMVPSSKGTCVVVLND